MIVINKNGTTRNIEEAQYNEYKRKGYKMVAEPTPVVEEKPKYNTVVTATTTTEPATTKKRNK